MSLRQQFNEVKNYKNAQKYNVVPIIGIKDAYIGSDDIGRPCVFIKSIGERSQPNLKTEKILLNIDQEYLFNFNNGSKKQDKFHALFCLSDSPDDIDTFLTLIEAFIVYNKEIIKVEDVISFFHSLLRLLLTKPVENEKATRQGLWGELFLMKYVKGYQYWAPFWQTETNRLFDFSTTGKRIEVKTTTKQDRVHVVSHRQVFSQDNEDIYISSIMLTEDDAGVSLRRLIDESREVFKETPYYLKIEKAIRHANMQNPQEEGPKYNILEAERTIKWYDSRIVPRFESAEPEGVSGTHYRIDLTNSVAIDSIQLTQWFDKWHE